MSKINELSLESTPAGTDHTVIQKGGTAAGQTMRVALSNLLGSASGETLEKDITQASHGFSVGDVLRHNGTNYVEATADSVANAVAAGVVSAVADTSNFTLTMSGSITTLSGLTAGEVYYLQDAGGLGTTVGTFSVPVLLATSTTAGIILSIPQTHTSEAFTFTAKVPIETQTLGAAGSFDFQNIPSGYDRLVIEGHLRGDVATDAEDVYMYANNDTTATNYFNGRLYGANAGVGHQEFDNPRIGLCTGASASAGNFGRVRCIIEDYDSTTKEKEADSFCGFRYGTDRASSNYLVWSWESTAAINRITIKTDNDPTDQFVSGSYLSLYGEKAITIHAGSGVLTRALSTTDATTTTILEVGVPADKALVIEGTAIALKDDGSSEGFTYAGHWQNDGGTTTNKWFKVVDGDAVERTLIQKTTLGAAGSFDFQNIPAGYDRLIIEGFLRSDVSASLDSTRIYLNNDTTDANYHRQVHEVANGVTNDSEGATSGIWGVAGGTAASNAYSSVWAVIEGYADTSKLTVVDAYAGGLEDAGAVRTGRRVVSWEDGGTAAVNRITIITDNDPTDQFVSGSHLALYAERTIGSGATYSVSGAADDTNDRAQVQVTGVAATNLDWKTTYQTFDSDGVVRGKGGGSSVANQVVKVELGRQVLGASGSFDFQNIPAGYDRLIIQGKLRGDVSAATDNARIFFNADTTETNYHYQQGGGYNGSVLVGENAVAGFANVPGATGPSNAFADVFACIEGYSDTTALKSALIQHGGIDAAGAVRIEVRTAVWEDGGATAITRIRIVTDNDPTDQFAAGSYVILYGEKTQ